MHLRFKYILSKKYHSASLFIFKGGVKKNKFMDEGDREKENNKRKSNKGTKGRLLNACDVLSSSWIRCAIQVYNGPNGVLLESRYCFLFPLRILLAFLYLTYEILK